MHRRVFKCGYELLIFLHRNEFLAVRNSDGGFFVCQAVQNVYKRTSRIKIRWLSQDKSEKSNEIYTPDFYDFIDFECILTNLDLTKVDKSKFRLPAKEHERTENILKKAIAVENGEAIGLDDSMTEDNPDGCEYFNISLAYIFLTPMFLFSGCIVVHRRRAANETKGFKT